MKKKILVIGSTGNLGKKLLNFCYINKINVSGITCYKNFNLIKNQKKNITLNTHLLFQMN